MYLKSSYDNPGQNLRITQLKKMLLKFVKKNIKTLKSQLVPEVIDILFDTIEQNWSNYG